MKESNFTVWNVNSVETWADQGNQGSDSLPYRWSVTTLVHGYLAHKKVPTTLGLPQGPSHGPIVGS